MEQTHTSDKNVSSKYNSPNNRTHYALWSCQQITLPFTARDVFDETIIVQNEIIRFEVYITYMYGQKENSYKSGRTKFDVE